MARCLRGWHVQPRGSDCTVDVLLDHLRDLDLSMILTRLADQWIPDDGDDDDDDMMIVCVCSWRPVSDWH